MSRSSQRGGESTDPSVLLRQVIGRRDPALAAILESGRSLSDHERELLRSIIADELVERGLDERDEHTRYGQALEDVIDHIGHL